MLNRVVLSPLPAVAQRVPVLCLTPQHRYEFHSENRLRILLSFIVLLALGLVIAPPDNIYLQEEPGPDGGLFPEPASEKGGSK